MNTLAYTLWHDEAGFILSAELVLVGTLTVIGLVAGLSHVRGAVIGEYKDIGDSLRSLDQSYSFGGFKGCKAITAGSAFHEDGTETQIDYTEVYRELPCTTPVICPPERQVILDAPTPVLQPSPCKIQPSPCSSYQPEFHSPPCGNPCSGCSPQTIVEQPCCNTRVEGEGRILPTPVPLSHSSSPCCDPSGSVQRERHRGGQGADEQVLPAPVFRGRDEYRGVDGNPQKTIRPYTDSVYNLKRYIESPYQHFAPRSSVW